MHFIPVRAARRVAGIAALGLTVVILAAGTTLPVGAQSVPAQSTCPAGAPVLQLGNPNPGDLVLNGDVVFSGLAFDPAATSGAGISSVDLFLGPRDSGGLFLGTAVPGASSATDPRLWQVKVTIPSSANGGRDFVAYATSSITGQATTVSVPVFVGAAPTPTPTGTNLTPVALTETTTTTCSGGAVTTAPSASTSASTSTSTSAGAPAVEPVAATTGEAPILSLANPTAGSVLSTGDLFVDGTVFDPASTSGAGIDSVQVFLDSRDNGGAEIGSGVPGVAGGSNPRAFSIKVTVPSNANGGHEFVVYARSSMSGQETMVSVPVFIGVAPTPTPRPHS